jgi:hypothetical protein
MSKSSYAPGELIGTIKFVFDKTKTRTLNATQAYDTNPSKIVLASYPAIASKKLLTKDLGSYEVEGSLERSGTAAVTLTSGSGTPADPGALLGKADRVILPNEARPISATVNFGTDRDPFVPGLTKSKKKFVRAIQPNTGAFSGDSLFRVNPTSTATKSNETKDIYYGAFTVGTGLYREWQGKYAVLKVDLLTNNAILRVYNS